MLTDRSVVSDEHRAVIRRPVSRQPTLDGSDDRRRGDLVADRHQTIPRASACSLSSIAAQSSSIALGSWPSASRAAPAWAAQRAGGPSATGVDAKGPLLWVTLTTTGGGAGFFLR